MSRSAHSLLKVVVGIIINPQRQLLVALRPENTPYAGLWEFPGGKREPHETAFDALKRELYEEVGVVVHKASPFLQITHDYGKTYKIVELDTWQIEDYDGTPYGREGQTIRWVDHKTLGELEFPEGNKAILDAVKEIL